MQRYIMGSSYLMETIFVIISIIALSIIEFIFFYNMYIPNVNIRTDIQFDYSGELTTNFSLINKQWIHNNTLNINYPDSSYPLSSQQYYDVLLHGTVSNIYDKTLILPINTTMVSQDGMILAYAVSSFVLPYRNYIIKLCRDILYIIPTLIGWSKQETKVSTTLLRDYYEDSINLIDSVKIDILSKGIDIYDMEIEFVSHLKGIKYYIYYWFWTSMCIIISFLIVLQSIIGILFYIYHKYAKTKVVRKKSVRQFSKAST
jgi:hypothetical protein